MFRRNVPLNTIAGYRIWPYSLHFGGLPEEKENVGLNGLLVCCNTVLIFLHD